MVKSFMANSKKNGVSASNALQTVEGAPENDPALARKAPEKSRTSQTGSQAGAQADRESRLAEALRANLRRRKTRPVSEPD